MTPSRRGPNIHSHHLPYIFKCFSQTRLTKSQSINQYFTLIPFIQLMQRKVLYTLKAENKQKYKHMHTFHQTLPSHLRPDTQTSPLMLSALYQENKKNRIIPIIIILHQFSHKDIILITCGIENLFKNFVLFCCWLASAVQRAAVLLL